MTGRAPAGVAESRFPNLDSIRALAALGVIVYHVTEAGLRLDPALTPLGERLNVVAVPLFMALSGFLLYRPFVAARSAGRPSPSLRRYAAGRVLRIAPAYWIALTILALTTPLQGGVLTGRFWIFYGLLAPYADWTRLTGLTHAWTLTLEVAFYVFLGVWVFASPRWRFSLRRELALLLTLAILSLAVQAAYQRGGGAWGNLDLTLPANLFLFAGGMAIAAVSASEGAARVARAALGRWPGLSWAAAAAVYWYLCYGLGLPPRGAPIEDYSTVGWLLEQVLGAVVALLVMLPAIFGAASRGAPSAVLGWPPLLYIGRVSYGVYLWHLAVLGWIQAAFGSMRTWDSLLFELIATIAVATAIAAISWSVIEEPLLRLKDLVPAQRRDRQRERHSPEEKPGQRPGGYGVPWQPDWAFDVGRNHDRAPTRFTRGWRGRDQLDGTGSALAVDGAQTSRRARAHEDVAVVDAADQLAGGDLQHPTAVGEADPASVVVEARRYHGQARDGSGDGA